MKWDPEKTDLVDKVIDELADFVNTEQISEGIRPTTLQYLGTEYDEIFHLFYAVAFGRNGRPNWAKKRFPATEKDPTGWESFIYEMQQKVAVSNAKRKGIKLNNKEMQVVMEAKEDYELGTKSEEVINKLKGLGFGEEKALKLFNTYIVEKEEITPFNKQDIIEAAELFLKGELNKEEVKELTGYEVNNPQVAKYFAKTHQKLDNLEKIVKKVKKEFDFSLLKFEKGLLFESLVGTYLVYKNGRENVNPQERKEVKYKDSKGQKHQEVYLDFYLNGGADHIYEVKWKNNIEGILNSILPQIYAVAKKKKSMPKATVICNEEAPGMLISQSAETYLIEDWNMRELNWKNVDLEDKSILFEANCQCPNIGIKDLFEYVTFENLIKGDKYENEFKAGLDAVRTLVDIEDIELIKNYSTALQRIYDNGEDIIAKVNLVTKKINQGELLTKEQLNMLGNPNKNLEERISTTHRRNIINGANKKQNNHYLISIYNIAFDENKKKLDDYMIEKLTLLDKIKFEEAAREYFIQKEDSLKTRRADIYFQTNITDIAVKELTKKYQEESKLIVELYELSDHMHTESNLETNIDKLIKEIKKQATLFREESLKSPKISKSLFNILNQEGKKYKSRVGASKALSKEMECAEKLVEEYITEFNKLDLINIKSIKEFTETYTQKFKATCNQPIIRIVHKIIKETIQKCIESDRYVNIEERDLLNQNIKFFSPAFRLPADYLPKIAKTIDILSIKGNYHLNKFVELFKKVKETFAESKIYENVRNMHVEILDIENSFSTALAIYSSALNTHRNTITSTYKHLEKNEYLEREIQQIAFIGNENLRKKTNETLDYKIDKYYKKIDSLINALNIENLNETIKDIELETEKLGMSVSLKIREIAQNLAEVYSQNYNEKEMLKQDRYVSTLINNKEEFYEEIKNNNLIQQRMINSYIVAAAIDARITSCTKKEAAVDYIKTAINIEEYKRIFASNDSNKIEDMLKQFIEKNNSKLTKQFKKEYNINFLDIFPQN